MARRTATQNLILAWANMAVEGTCTCGYYKSAPRHSDPTDPAYHPFTLETDLTYGAALEQRSAREWIAADGKPVRRNTAARFNPAIDIE